MSELKLCPFCGSHNVTKVIEGTRHPMIYVRCNGCLSMSGWYEADEESIMVSAWNTRVGEQKEFLYCEQDIINSYWDGYKDGKDEKGR